jgi:murein DD-endopeptidase MepM/ murein hydrolase activator NlpD
MSQFPHRAKKLFDKWFPERQIYHRSGGTVRYVSLRPSHQALLALAAVGVAGWCAYATINVVMGNQVLTAQESEIDRREAKYKRWLAEARLSEAAAQAQLKERTVAFEKATREFERRHETLKLLLNYAGGSQISAAATPIERDGDKMLMQASIEEAEPRVSRSWEPSAPYNVQTVGFRASVERIKADQAEFLANAEEGAVMRSEQIRGVLRMTGVGFSHLAGSDDEAMGGPLLPIDLSGIINDGDIDPAFARRVEQVAARVAEANRLDAIANATPLSPPVHDARQTSGFGPRYDPINGRLSFHSGLDVAAFHRAPILSTQAGTVSFAGEKSGYGRVVEIDHGHGFKTRYGHLSDYTVAKGERVAIGQRIGSMGSSGRSTGTHLHYEIQFRGKVYDPVHFLRAGRHVHEQG